MSELIFVRFGISNFAVQTQLVSIVKFTSTENGKYKFVPSIDKVQSECGLLGPHLMVDMPLAVNDLGFTNWSIDRQVLSM